MAQRPMTEDQARDLLVRQLNDLRRHGAAPDSQARLAAIFTRNEAARREQEARAIEGDMVQQDPLRSAP